MRACWLKWVGRDWSISADYIWLNYSDANSAPDFNVFMAINFVGKVLNSDIGHAAFNLSEHLDHANVELCPVLLVAKFLLSMA